VHRPIRHLLQCFSIVPMAEFSEARTSEAVFVSYFSPHIDKPSLVEGNSPCCVRHFGLRNDLYCSPVLRHSAELIQAANFRSAVVF
jgi:hypothetical protein